MLLFTSSALWALSMPPVMKRCWPISPPLLTTSLRFYALEQHDAGQPLTPKFIHAAGSEWAKMAQHLILEELDQISVQNLMVSSPLAFLNEPML